jgi:hypothetical protein
MEDMDHVRTLVEKWRDVLTVKGPKSDPVLDCAKYNPATEIWTFRYGGYVQKFTKLAHAEHLKYSVEDIKFLIKLAREKPITKRQKFHLAYNIYLLDLKLKKESVMSCCDLDSISEKW